MTVGPEDGDDCKTRHAGRDPSGRYQCQRIQHLNAMLRQRRWAIKANWPQLKRYLALKIVLQ